MGITRDFTDAAKAELGKAVDAAQAQRDGWWIFNDAWDWISDPFIGSNINNYNSDIAKYHEDIVDKMGTTREQLNKIFADVYAVDNTYVTKVNVLISNAEPLKRAFTALAEVFNPAPLDGGSFILGRTPAEFSEYMSKDVGTVYDDLLKQFVTFDAQGNPTYNWDAIDAALNKDAADITDMEYLALASLYANMSPEDVEKFMQMLADLKENHKGGFLELGYPNSYSMWEYDEEKIEGLQKYLGMHDALLQAQQISLDSLSDEELRQLLQSTYPEIDFSSVDMAAQRKDLIRSLEKDRFDLLQKQSLLTTVGTLGGNPDSDSGFGYITCEMNGLNGDYDASGPALHIEKNDAGAYVLTYHNTSVTTYTMSESPFPSINNMNANTITISGTVGGTDAVDLANDNVKNYFSAKYNYSFGQSLVSNGSSAVVEFATGELLDQIATSVSGKVAENAIPIIGDIIFLGVDLLNEKVQHDKDVEEAGGVISVLDDASYCNKFRFDANMVTTGDASQSSLLWYPSKDTYTVIDNLNRELAKDLSKDDGLQVDYPISLDEVMQYPDDINKLLSNFPPETRNAIYDY